MKASKYNLIVNEANNIILLNTYTGAVCRIDQYARNFLESGLTIRENVSPIAEKALIDNGFIVPDHLDEYARVLDDEQRNLYGATNAINLVIALTMACNYKCKYCFENCVATKETATQEEIDIMLAFIEKHITDNKIKHVHISWFGGEPLLMLDKIEYMSKELIKFCDDEQVEYKASIITNGYLLTEDAAKTLKDCRVNNAQVSLDGPESIYEDIKGTPAGAYKRVIENVKIACKYLRISLRLNFMPTQYDQLNAYIDELATYYDRNDNILVYLAEMHDYDKDERYCETFYSTAKAVKDYVIAKQMNASNLDKLTSRKLIHCGLIKKNNFVIGPHAELYKCEHSIGHPDEVVGSCVDGPYYNSAYYRHSKVERPAKCKDCDIMPFCMSRCPNDILTGIISDASCEGYRQHIIEHYKQQYRK